jgi:ADP-ribose pyrophosphatase YjhB (NUDIX family)
MAAVIHVGSDPRDPSLTRLERSAVRGVAWREGRLLLLRSRHGDHKFPGGGVETGESLAEALRREMREECGVPDPVVGDLLLTVVETRPAREPDTLFVMTSHYLACEVDGSFGTQALEAYEAELGLEPVWVTPDEARRANEAMRTAAVATPPWWERETRVLALLAGGAAG